MSYHFTGAVETIDKLRKDYNLKIGTSTGFTKLMMETIKPLVAKQGYVPDFYGTADLAPRGRPTPNLLWLNAIHLDVAPIQAVVKVRSMIFQNWFRLLSCNKFLFCPSLCYYLFSIYVYSA